MGFVRVGDGFWFGVWAILGTRQYELTGCNNSVPPESNGLALQRQYGAAANGIMGLAVQDALIQRLYLPIKACMHVAE